MAKKKTGMSPLTIVLICLAVILVIAGIFFLQYRNRIKHFKDENTTGNTSGNLLNGGRFASIGDTIFFANPYDDNTLYSMDHELKHVKKLTNDTTSYINAAGSYLFYTRRNDQKSHQQNALLTLSTTGLYRASTKGKNLSQLYDDPTQSVLLHGNTLFYQHYDQKEGLLLYGMDIDGSDDKLLLDEGVIPVSVINNNIYYAGVKTDHYIHSKSIDGSSEQIVYKGNCTSLAQCGDYIYYLDMDNNYTLCRVQTDGTHAEVLVNQRIATYNVSEDNSIIYYQVDDGDHNGLYAMNINAGTSKTLRTGNFNYLHLIDDYLFFEKYDGSEAFVMNTTTEQIDTFRPQTSSKKKD